MFHADAGRARWSEYCGFASHRTGSRELRLEHEQDACESVGITFVSFPIPHRAVPSSLQTFKQLIEQLTKELLAGKSVGMHCRQSIGRSAVLAAALLCSFGSSADAAFAQIEHCRGCAVPDTEEQREWVRRFSRQETKPQV
jgi:protein-tyrosine phosphatase